MIVQPQLKVINVANEERRLRRIAFQRGVKLMKSRVRTPTKENQGRYAIANSYGAPIYGGRYELDLELVRRILESKSHIYRYSGEQ
jgi:hypothetical protein